MGVEDVACEDNSFENNSNDEYDGDDENRVVGNPKLADALNKVLRMTKKKVKDKSIVLSKAKLHGVKKHVKETCGFEVAPNPIDGSFKKEVVEDIKPEVKEEKKAVTKDGLTKHERLKRGRVIPNVLDKEKERQLTRIATRGVVQLFNAVRQQQSTIEKQFKEKKLTEAKREKILKSIDGKSFMNALSGQVKILSNDTIKNEVSDVEIKEEEENEEIEHDAEKPSWQVLRNDFMMGAKLKDWDKKQEDDELNS